MLGFSNIAALAVFLFAAAADAHLAAWHKGMYCLNGVSGREDFNSYDIVSPLYQLSYKDWWFHGVNGCNKFPPAEGDYIDLPAGGRFMVEIASNRAKTSLAYNGRDTSSWPDGETYPENYNAGGACITSPNMHTQNHGNAAGTAFAISYQSDINQVTPQNLVVFSVAYGTPWKREAWYDVPKAMPACGPGGCICAWGWVPNGCGQPNMYHTAFKCRVSGATSTTPVGNPKPPVWCEGNPGACTQGPKQMIYWNQLEGNNIQVSGLDASGQPKSPAYNMKLGFADGAQNDIFAGPPSSGSGSTPNNTPPASPPSKSGSSNSGTVGTGTGSGGTPSSGSTDAGTSGGGTGAVADRPPVAADTAAPASSSTVGGSSPSSASSSIVSTPTYVDRPSCKRRSRRNVLERENTKLKRSIGSHHHRKRMSF